MQEYDDNGHHAEPQAKFPRGPPPTPNKVLLFTIINAIYPITTVSVNDLVVSITHSNNFRVLFQKVIESICKDSGEVQRIVIFRKRGVQAMVEYPLKQTITLESQL